MNRLGFKNTHGPTIGPQRWCLQSALVILCLSLTKRHSAWSFFRPLVASCWLITLTAWEDWSLTFVHRTLRRAKILRYLKNLQINIKYHSPSLGKLITTLRSTPTSTNCSTSNNKPNLFKNYLLPTVSTIWNRPIGSSSKSYFFSVIWCRKPCLH